MDEATRPRDDRPAPPDDEGEAVFFDEAPAGRTGTGEGPIADETPDALLADEAPSAGADEELAPDAAAEADLLERAPGEPDEPPRPAPATPLADARALLHTRPRHPVGEGRASAAVPAAALAPSFTPQAVRAPPPSGGVVAGQATCPACGARSGWDARVCGRCGADIPPPVPAADPGLRVAPGMGLTPLGVARPVEPRRPAEGDDGLDVLPADVRERVLAARERNARHTEAVTAGFLLRKRNLTIMLVVVATVAGLLCSVALRAPPLPTLVCAPLDAALGWALAWWVWRTDVTASHGAVSFGLAAGASLVPKLILAPIVEIGFAFPSLVLFALLSTTAGILVCMKLEGRPHEHGF